MPPVDGRCVANCGGGNLSEREQPQPRPRAPGPSPAEIEQQFQQAAGEYKAVIEDLNDLIWTASNFDDAAVKDSVLTIFGKARHFSVPNTRDISVLEADVRTVMARYPGLRSAALYQSYLPALSSRTVEMGDRLRRLQALRGELQQWYLSHPGRIADADYKRQVANRAQQVEQLDQASARMFEQARSLARSATRGRRGIDAAAVADPEGDDDRRPHRDSGRAIRKGADSCHAAVANLLVGMRAFDFPRGLREMPDWQRLGPRMASWYLRYAEHFAVLAGGDFSVMASADPVPQPPGPAEITAASAGQARGQIQSEILALSHLLEQLSGAVVTYKERHGRYLAAVADYAKQANGLKEAAKPAFQGMHLDALSALMDDEARHRLRTLYMNSYEAVRSAAWENIANQLSTMPPVTGARQEAMKSAIKLIPAVQDFANNEFNEIMKGPEVIAFGDETAAAGSNPRSTRIYAGS